MDFKMNINKYNFFVKNIIFNEPKKEKEIFDLLVKGYNANEIGIKIGIALTKKLNMYGKLNKGR